MVLAGETAVVGLKPERDRPLLGEWEGTAQNLPPLKEYDSGEAPQPPRTSGRGSTGLSTSSTHFYSFMVTKHCPGSSKTQVTHAHLLLLEKDTPSSVGS